MSTRVYHRLAQSASAFGLMAFFATAARAASKYGLNLQAPVTPVARDIYHLHMEVFYVCVAILVVVAGIMFYSLIFHRKSLGHKPATFHESTTVEIIWTIVPFFILIAMAIPATTTLLKIANTRPGADLVVKVTGYQWKWRYSYPEQHIAFFSSLSTPISQIENLAPKNPHYLLQVDHPLVLPVGEKVRFLITANDVIHGWWVPALGIQNDAVPGFIHEGWAEITKPGTYRGQCAQLCGQGHGFMPIVIKAVPQAEFVAWVKQQQALSPAGTPPSGTPATTGTTPSAASATTASAAPLTKAELMAKGQKIYQNCAVCHGPEGKGVPGQFPALAHDKIVNGPLANHIKTVLNGVSGTAMPAWGPQLGNTDVAAVVTFERNSFGNHTGDVVQPSQVKALR